MAGAVVTYARPFSPAKEIGVLPRRFSQFENANLQAAHRELILLRNKVYGHQDASDLSEFEIRNPKGLQLYVTTLELGIDIDGVHYIRPDANVPHVTADSVPATFAQNSALDAPGEKRVTVGSEIGRGSSDIFTEVLNRLDLSIIALNAHMADVIVRNQSRQADSVGFILGARYQEWRQIELLLHSPGVRQFNSAAEIESGLRDSKSYFAQMRSLQMELGIGDGALIRALGITNPDGIAQIKAQIAAYIATTGIK